MSVIEFPKKEEEEDSYQITPKGWLAVELMEHLSMDELDDLWMDLEEFIQERAIYNGCEEGVSCLVFDGGGCCVTTPKQEG
jgi:hypothetical protein